MESQASSRLAVRSRSEGPRRLGTRSPKLSRTESDGHADPRGSDQATQPVVLVTSSLPWRFSGGTGGHGRALAITFLLQIVPSGRGWRARACPRVHRLMYPSRTRDALSICETGNGPDCASLASPIVAARTRGDEVRARVAELGRRPPGDLATMSRTTKKVLFPASSLWSARPPRPHVADRSHQRLPTTSSTRSASFRSGWRACARPTR
jgi:hypothetical protein